MKTLFTKSGLLLLLICFTLAMFAACTGGDTPSADEPTVPTKLQTPVVTVSEYGVASWQPIENASGYSYVINNGSARPTEKTSITLSDGQSIKVMAVSDSDSFSNSEYSAVVTYHAPAPDVKYCPVCDGDLSVGNHSGCAYCNGFLCDGKDHSHTTPTEDMTVSGVLAGDLDVVYRVKGIVCATAPTSFLLTDGSGNYLYVYAEREHGLEEGDVARVVGTKVEYANITELKSVESIEALDEDAVLTRPELIEADKSFFILQLTDFEQGAYVTFTAPVTVSGNYLNVAIEGIDGVMISLVQSGYEFESGEKYTITGYLIYISGTSNKYITVLTTDVRPAGSSETEYCPVCNGDLSVGNHELLDCDHRACQIGDHALCDACGDYKCKNDHGYAPCGIHRVCEYGAHTLLDCGHYACQEGDHSDKCPNCGGYTCLGGDHSALPCGEHFVCKNGNEHNHYALDCGHFACQGGEHYVCSSCEGYICQGDHEICKENQKPCQNCGNPSGEGNHSILACGHYACDGKDHSISSCGHYVCEGGEHEKRPCGHYSCKDGDHSMTDCGHYVCEGGEHEKRPCGHYSCEGGDHSRAGCGHYVCDGKDHGKRPCGHFICDDSDHSMTDCGHYVCEGGEHEKRPCGHYSCESGDHSRADCGHYVCDGKDHGKRPCGHFICDDGNHTLCDACHGYLCTGNHEMKSCGNHRVCEVGEGNTCAICDNPCYTGHKYTETVTEPTCTNQGYTTHTCTVCGDSYKDSFTPVNMLNHSYRDEIVPPTCIGNGYTVKTCTGCGHNYKTTYTDPTGVHSYTAELISPTCTKEGYTLHTCTGCGITYTDTPVYANWHTYSNGICSICGEEQAPSVERPLYEFKDGFIFFGEYPQTVKSDDVAITRVQNDKGYYLGTDGEWYKREVAKPYKNTIYNEFNNDQLIVPDEIYFFKVEPIKWIVLPESNGNTYSLVCASIIDTGAFNSRVDVNNYIGSEVREWLLEEFCKNAFTSAQKDLLVPVLTGTADNGTDVKDTAYLLTKRQASSMTQEQRVIISSDYARAVGLANAMDDETTSFVHGSAMWWLRTPDGSSTSTVGREGTISRWMVYSPVYGYVPGITVTIPQS